MNGACSGAIQFILLTHQSGCWLQGKEGRSVPITWSGVPSMQDLQPFLGMASVLLSRTVFSMMAFTIITGVATSRGTVAAATHQVCLQLFWFLSYFPEPLSVAAQSLIARDRGDRGKMVVLTRCIGGTAAALGVSIAAACASCFCFSSGAFTANAAIAASMASLALPAGIALILCSLAMAADGVSIGSEDYKHLPVVNFLGLGATAMYLQWCNMQGYGLIHIWQAMVVVFAVRLSVHMVHHLGTNAGTSTIAEAMGCKGLWQRRSPIWQAAPSSA
jgi:Na+-driven multidrug efflux pump